MNEAKDKSELETNKIVKSQPELPVPQTVFGQRLRTAAEGIHYLVRKHKKAIAYLDERMERVGPLQWMIRIGASKNIENLRSVLESKPLYIVGKGPSLDFVAAKNFEEYPDSPIICINESVLIIAELDLPNPIIALQVDSKVGKLAFDGKRITSTEIGLMYKDTIQVHHVRYGRLSVEVALGIGHDLGVTKFVLFAFDAAKNQKLGYARCIGKDPIEGGDPRRFLQHAIRIKKAAGDIPVKFI